MAKQLFADHAERGQRGQWQLEDLPWDEPVEFCGESAREKALNKLDLLEVAQSLYHFQLGARIRMGDHLVRSWLDDEPLAECLEWHDLDDQRHIRGLRRLMVTLRNAGPDISRNATKIDPRRMWQVSHGAPSRPDDDRLLLRLLVDEFVCRALFGQVGRRSHVPLVKALFNACAQDDERHVGYLSDLHRSRSAASGTLGRTLQQASTVAHVARVQNAFRPYLRSFAGATHSSHDDVAIEIFRAISQGLSATGPAWERSPLARLIHTADRSPWLLWLLR